MIDLYTLHAREILGMPDTWQAYRWECLPKPKPDQPHQVHTYKIVGAVAPLLTKGARVGTPNWKQLDKATEREAYFTPAQHDAWCAAWEHHTGQCRTCTGDGTVLVSWSVTQGQTTRACPRCHGTGQAAPSAGLS